VGVDVLLGLQWGDEGKGKIVDYLAPKYNLVCRFQGGPNAGHTLEFDNIKHVLHQIPSGVFRENIENIIGNGVVLDPVVFKKEVDALSNLGVDCRKNLFISKRTSLILPTHRVLDAAYEAAKGEDKIGSTLRGIGPTYQDKIGRLGLRVGDITLSDFSTRYRSLADRHEDILNHHDYDYNLEELEAEFFQSIEFLKTFNLVDNELLVNKAIDENKTILAEGAQGSMLDIDFGSYPFVTSSNTMTAGACTGLGVAPSRIGEVFGIFKAYCTRVGSGPFPTELFDETGERLRKEGAEFGATTGRPRRCGWLDLPALKYTVTINGVTQLFMMKGDVLNNFDEIKVCTGYKMQDGSEISRLTFESLNEKIEPVYRSFKGWNCSLEDIHDFQNLPEELLNYVEFIESELGVPINIVSVGPNRSETIIRNLAIA
jgi:adenylosuccinate synthase